MNELIPIRSWLAGTRGRWSKIAAQTGLSVKTVQRIARGEVASVSLRTYVALRDAMEGRDAQGGANGDRE